MITPRPPIPSLRAIRLAAAALAAGALLTTAPAHGSAGYVAAGPSGSAHFAWTQHGAGSQIFERKLSANGTLSPAQAVSWAHYTALPVDQAVGVDASGAALIAWTSEDDALISGYVRSRALDGSLGPVQQVSPAGADVEDLRLAVEPDGDAVVVWSRRLAGHRVIQARRRAAGGALGPVRTVSYAGGDANSPDVAVAANGAATMAWVRWSPQSSFAQSRTLAPDDTLSDYQRLSATAAYVSHPRVTVDAAGTAVLAWARQASPETSTIESRARSAGGVLGPVQTIAPAGEFNGMLVSAGNGGGRTAFAWAKWSGGNHYSVLARVRRPDGGLGPVFDVSEGPGQSPHLAVDPHGHVSFAWKDDDGGERIETRRRTAAGAMGPVRTVSDPAQTSQAPNVAVDAAGKATVAFYQAPGNYAARTVTPSGTLSPLYTLGAQD